jgi:hypothetical protein
MFSPHDMYEEITVSTLSGLYLKSAYQIFMKICIIGLSEISGSFTFLRETR